MNWQLAKDEELDEDQYELEEFAAQETRGSRTERSRAKRRAGVHPAPVPCTSA